MSCAIRSMLTSLMGELAGDDGRPGGALLRQVCALHAFSEDHSCTLPGLLSSHKAKEPVSLQSIRMFLAGV